METEKEDKRFDNRELITTSDGSSSLYLKSIDETYHSTKGALTESIFVFIESGLSQITGDKIRVFEVGMGTALNVLLSAIYSAKHQIELDIVSIEPYPLNPTEWEALSYGLDEELFRKIHQAPFEDRIQLNSNCSFTKKMIKLEDWMTSDNQFDIVYMDAFAPSKQAEIWSINNLRKLHDSLKVGGRMVTYCAQGQFKRDLRTLGFEVQNPPGPMGKKEMTIAIKKGQ